MLQEIYDIADARGITNLQLCDYGGPWPKRACGSVQTTRGAAAPARGSWRRWGNAPAGGAAARGG